jgi:hypothetical protein
LEQHGEDHLPQVRTMILAVAVLAQRLAAGALEVKAGGVHEHQVETDGQRASQFLWTRQLHPSVFSVRHIPAAFSIDAKGPTMAR